MKGKKGFMSIVGIILFGLLINGCLSPSDPEINIIDQKFEGDSITIKSANQVDNNYIVSIEYELISRDSAEISSLISGGNNDASVAFNVFESRTVSRGNGNLTFSISTVKISSWERDHKIDLSYLTVQLGHPHDTRENYYFILAVDKEKYK